MDTRRSLTRATAEEAQAIVMVAMMSTFLMMILAIAMETGFIWIQKRELQTAADSAALAGAQELDGTSASEGAAVASAEDYANANVDALVSNNASVEDNYRAVRAEVSKNASTVFASWFGFGGIEINAQAVAQIAAPLWPGPGVVPLTIDEATYELCADPDTGIPHNNGDCEGVTLKEYAGNNDDPPSSYGLLDLGGTGGGANEVCNYLIGGSAVAITDPTAEKTGNVSSLHNCLIDRITAAEEGPDGGHPCLTLDDVTLPDGTIDPVCDPLQGAGKGSNSSYPDRQPTALVLIPIVKSFTDNCGTGPKCLDIVGDGVELRLFAYFLIDAEATVLGPSPSCAPPGGGGGPGGGGPGGGGPGGGGPGGGGPGGGGPGGGSGQCHITGDFLFQHKAPVSTSFDLPTGEFDPTLSLLKIIQLIE